MERVAAGVSIRKAVFEPVLDILFVLILGGAIALLNLALELVATTLG